jgi:hypothetical protein
MTGCRYSTDRPLSFKKNTSFIQLVNMIAPLFFAPVIFAPVCSCGLIDGVMCGEVHFTSALLLFTLLLLLSMSLSLSCYFYFLLFSISPIPLMSFYICLLTFSALAPHRSIVDPSYLISYP